MLRVRTGGAGDPPVLLLHGLGATGAVWDGLTGLLDRRRLVPDLPGHGGSARLARYSFGGFAAAIADTLAETEPGIEPIVVGHSLGGVIALTLASGWFGMRVAGVVAVGVKVEWSEDDLAKAAAFGARPPRVFETREDAERAALRVAGLTGLVSAVEDGIVRNDGAGDGWRLTLDPAAFAVGRPDMRGLLDAARCPVMLAAGEHDPMSRPDQLRALRSDAETLPGLGHNAHVENPRALLPLIDRVEKTKQ